MQKDYTTRQRLRIYKDLLDLYAGRSYFTGICDNVKVGLDKDPKKLTELQTRRKRYVRYDACGYVQKGAAYFFKNKQSRVKWLKAVINKLENEKTKA